MICRLCDKEAAPGRQLCNGDCNLPEGVGVTFVYTGPLSLAERRNVHPKALAYTAAGWMLEAWDLDRKENDQILLSRIGFWEEDPRLRVFCKGCGHPIERHFRYEREGQIGGGCNDKLCHQHAGIWGNSCESNCDCREVHAEARL